MLKVLLIEDSLTLQYELIQYLEEYGAEVIATRNGETALQFLEQYEIELVICDVDMPGLNGLETVPIIREHFSYSWVPIFFITGRDGVDDFVSGFEAGADDYLIKPISKQVLHAKLKVMQRFISMQHEKKLLLNETKRLYRKDYLTQVYTKAYFFELAQFQWSILSRQNLAVSFLLIAVDHFDDFQRYYDEVKSQIVLTKIAAAVQTTIQRPGDFIGRYDDNVFIVMLPDTGFNGAAKVAGKICRNIENLAIEHKRSRVSGVVTVSIGGGICIRLKDFGLEGTVKIASSALKHTQEITGNSFTVSKHQSMKISNIEVRNIQSQPSSD